MNFLFNINTKALLIIIIILMTMIPFLTKITIKNMNTYSNFLLSNILYIILLSILSYYIYIYNKDEINFNISNYELNIFFVLCIISIFISIIYLELFKRHNISYLLPIIPAGVILL